MTSKATDISSLLTCAVRYAIGRSSYMPGIVIAQTRICLDELDQGAKEAIVRDIRSFATSEYSKDMEYLAEWQALADDIEALEARK